MLSLRINIYKFIASAAPEIQEKIIAEVYTLNAEGLGKYKHKRKLDVAAEDGRKMKKQRVVDQDFQVMEAPGMEMDTELDHPMLYVFVIISSRNDMKRRDEPLQECSGRPSVEFVYANSNGRRYQQVHKPVHRGDK